MSFHIIIPARYASTRLPGKPLHPIAGVALLQRVWAIAASVVGTDGVTVATDDERIAEFCNTIGADCVMTAESLPNGTARAAAAMDQVDEKAEGVINLQGDAVLTPPWVLKEMLAAMENDKALQMVTPAMRMTRDAYEKMKAAKAAGEVGGTSVVFDHNHNALYFSKSLIPFLREPQEPLPAFRHIGLYGYRKKTLDRLVSLQPSTLEKAESLEQLRALENGIPIRVVEVDYRGRSHIGVDSAADVERAEKLIAAEGELLPVYDGSYKFIP